VDSLTQHLERLDEIRLIARTSQDNLDINTTDGRILGNALARSGLVLLSGYFEGFLRDVVEEFIEKINDAGLPLRDLPAPLIHDQAEFIVNRSAESPDCSSIFELRDALKDGATVWLNPKRYNKTGGNPTVEVIEKNFSRLGLFDIIDSLSVRDFGLDSTYINETQVHHSMISGIRGILADHAVQDPDIALESITTEIESKWRPKRKRRDVGYVNQIQELLKRRNRVAHGEGYQQITPPELCGFVDSIEALSRGLSDALDIQLIAVQAT
jgi:hypothetical protein